MPISIHSMYCSEKTFKIEQEKVLLWEAKRERKKTPSIPMKTGFYYILLATLHSRYFVYYYYFWKAYGPLASKHPGGICMHKPKCYKSCTMNSKLGNKELGKNPKLLFRRYTFKELQSHPWKAAIVKEFQIQNVSAFLNHLNSCLYYDFFAMWKGKNKSSIQCFMTNHMPCEASC